jgi:hypothetical protein
MRRSRCAARLTVIAAAVGVLSYGYVSRATTESLPIPTTSLAHVAHHRGDHHPHKHKRRLPLREVRLVRHPDVDGDGHPDRVVLNYTQVSDAAIGQGRVTMRVDFRSGAAASVSRHVMFWTRTLSQPRLPFVGATNLDGRPGRELLLGDDQGAANVFFHVFTARHHRLVALAPPPGTDGGTANWNLGGSVGTGAQQFVCHRHSVRVVATRPAKSRRLQDQGLSHVTRTTSRWTAAGWRTTRVVHHVGTGKVASGACPGFEQF